VALSVIVASMLPVRRIVELARNVRVTKIDAAHDHLDRFLIRFRLML
jgi:hypothetical protein